LHAHVVQSGSNGARPDGAGVPGCYGYENGVHVGVSDEEG
jgi:hypothetical protein